MSIQQLRNLTTLCYIEQDGKYLMLHRTVKKNDVNKDKWIGVGGHFEADESPEECILREVKEETGIELDSEVINDPFLKIIYLNVYAYVKTLYIIINYKSTLEILFASAFDIYPYLTIASKTFCCLFFASSGFTFGEYILGALGIPASMACSAKDNFEGDFL